ncbi:MAG: hemolysin family protein [Treponemataceae bacterium]
MDEGSPYIGFLLLLSLIVLNGFFSMSEMAIVSSRKSRLKAKADEGKKAYLKALKAAQDPSRFLSTIQIGITLIGILSGAFGGTIFAKPLARLLSRLPFLAHYAEGIALFLVVLSITVLSIVLGELTPKQFALSNPEKIAAFSVPILEKLAVVFNPIVTFLSHTTTFMLKTLRISESSRHMITEEEIRGVILEGELHGVVEEKERRMVEGVFYLGDRPVETFMTHRSELVWLEEDSDDQTIRKIALGASNQSMVPIIRAGLDDIVGVVRVPELLASLLDGTWSGLKPLIKEACFVPGSMSSLRVFEVFKREGVDMILILDEYGGLAGALSLRDIIEEIVGELSQTATDMEEIVKREDGSYLMGGLVNVDEFAELFSFQKEFSEHREYHTLAGLILDILGVIPKTGEIFNWNGIRFEIVDMDGNRIDKVLITPPKPEHVGPSI